jgi:CubicO group peptidase (beta-lactamase class C family)
MRTASGVLSCNAAGLVLVAFFLCGTPAWAGNAGEFIAGYAASHDFNGTILVRRGGATLYSGSFGLANFQHQVRNTTATRYKIASITKAFTAVLVLQFVEEGRLNLERPIAAYLPSYAGEGARRVTIHQLLNHTSGIENFDRVTSAEEAIRKGIPQYQLPHDTESLLRDYCSGRLVSEPGTKFSYNNADYIILGKIVEAISGADFGAVLRERILAPLGLRDTGMLLQADIVANLADTYFRRDDLARLVPDLPAYPENWYAAGAMYSTTADLAKFSDALFGGKLLKAATLERMLKPGLDGYGYGLWSYETEVAGRKHRVAKRPGQIMGAQSQLYRFLDTPVTIIILGNTGTTNLDEFVAEIGKRVVD